MPERIQQRRTRGWRKPENTVSVARPSRYGNPFRIGDRAIVNDATNVIVDHSKRQSVIVRDRAHAVELYRDAVEGRTWVSEPNCPFIPTRAEIARLRGKNLMCFCPLDRPCHAEVLLELANREAADA
ncbi:MAG: hypothetical protein BGN98_13805 [Microbacterium sp. 69-7]|uniref:DUF4326 domain-containing protein n=1 Tax=Microbacterium sp. 69-7 TaxID=1895784 RepID=UPI00095D75D7|nr:DUF4326 domain-containing protein [Microbacterium sp. 69-7]OJU44455.1 MAG: hypothetical protein BGN98_13805 [Microbacterium sp. 69-7]